MTDQERPPTEGEDEHGGSGPWHDGAAEQATPMWQDAEDMETAERSPADEPDDADPPAG
jgi:hypothetical protein